MKRHAPNRSAGPISDEAATFRDATSALELQRWAEARERLLDLARRSPGTSRYRALLAYARGHEARERGDHVRARQEWHRALILDASLHAAAEALSARPRRRSWVASLFRGA